MSSRNISQLHVFRSLLNRRSLLGVGLGLFAAWGLAEQAGPMPATHDLLDMSIEDLMNIEVTSPSKKAQSLSAVPAAVYVITGDDIRRSGVRSIPEALRLAPGVQVLRIDSNKWAISIRGFTRGFSDKLLVLIDGRTVYTPLFSGVFWDVQDTVLDDIDRIEVIRGPGGTLWGANAVNGVINIITKDTKHTQGGLLKAGIGTERGFATGRYGGRLSQDAHYRIYTKYFQRDGGVEPSGEQGADDWDQGRAGFRTDWTATARDSVTVQGELYKGESGEKLRLTSTTAPFVNTVANDQQVSGGNILGRWRRTLSPYSELELQLYYDRTERTALLFGEERDTVDVDFQHRFPLFDGHDVVWGLGYRYTADDIENTRFVTVDPASREDQLFSAFVQDEVTLIPGQLRFSLGTKLEHNDYTGFDYQPSARLLWTPVPRNVFWTAITRAVRTPSRADRDTTTRFALQGVGAIFDFPLPVTTEIRPNKDFQSEELIAYEVGYRVQPMEHLGIDLTGFYNDYDKVRGATIDASRCEPSGIPLAMNPFCIATAQVVSVAGTLDNKAGAHNYGFEIAVDWKPRDWWRLSGHYSFLEENTPAPLSPPHQFSLLSSMDLRHDVQADVWMRYADAIPDSDIDSYLNLDARLAWLPYNNLELSVVGQNLIDGQHQEFLSERGDVPIEIERSGYLQFKWLF